MTTEHKHGIELLIAVLILGAIALCFTAKPEASKDHIPDVGKKVGQVEALVLELQDKVGVEADGIVGKETVKAVNKAVEKERFDAMADRDFHTRPMDVNEIKIVKAQLEAAK